MWLAQGYIDDLLIASPDIQSDEQHVRAVLKRPDESEVTINQSVFSLFEP